MNVHVFPALAGDNPRDFLAALGLLKLVTVRWPEAGARLAWSDASHPALTPINIPDSWADDLTTSLQELENDPRRPLRHHTAIKTTSDLYREAVRRAVEFSNNDHPLAELPAALYAAYSSQLTDEKSGDINPTAFSFANGQGGKHLLADVCQLIRGLEVGELEESLKGTRKPVAAKSMRWEPAEYRPAAYRGPNPGVKVKGDDILDHPVFNILAFFGLTYFPCVPTERGGTTAGFVRDKREWFFRWPLWSQPLSDLEAFSLVNLPKPETSRRQGVREFWQSRRFSADKSLYFAPAERVF